MAQNFSYWEYQSYLGFHDVVIIGSGIVGLSCALSLIKREPSIRICVLEAGFLPSGASTKNAGFACFGSVSEALDEIENGSEDVFLKLVEMRWAGLKKLRENLGDAALDYQPLGGYEVFKKEDHLLATKCADSIGYLNSLLRHIIKEPDIYSVDPANTASFGFNGIDLMIRNKCEGQLDTGKMMRSLLRKVQSLGVQVLNNCRVLSIQDEGCSKKIMTQQAEFKCSRVVVATNAFVRQLLPELDVRPGRGQVLVTNPIPELQLKGAFHYNKGFTYFRNIGDRVLIGGGRDLDFEAEETFEAGSTPLVQNYLEDFLRQVILPNTPFEIEHRWSGVMGFGPDLIPIVKEAAPGVICAVRCSGMGVAMGSLLGEQAGDIALQS